jgi:pilus assembly protein FimV
MVLKSLKWAVAGLVICPPAALALGLGDIRLNSSLNAPLDADVELVGATAEELTSLKAQIASRDTFAKYGLDWPAYLGSITLRAMHTADGRDVVKLHSTDVITEPFITLLVEVTWDRGHSLREYTMLLDPPVYTPNASQVANAPVAAPMSGASVHQGSIERAAPATESGATAAASTATEASTQPGTTQPSVASQPAAANPSSSAAESSAGQSGAAAADNTENAGTAGSDSIDVHRGDTLSRIAARVAGSDKTQERRWMVAAFQANPEAFVRNMNLLRSGSVLRVPTAEQVAAVSASTAAAEVHRQYAAWRGAAPAPANASAEPGRLHLVTPTESSAGTPGAAGSTGTGAGAGAGAADVKALQSRVAELQSQLDESHRLLDLKNSQLADLQAKIGERAAAPPAVAGVAHGASQSSAESRATQASAQSLASASSATAESASISGSSSASETPPLGAAASTSASSEASLPSSAAPPPAARPVINHKPVTAPPAPEASWLGTLKGLWWIGAIVIAALLGFLGFRAWSSRRKEDFDDSLGRLAEAGAASLERGREPVIEGSPQIAPMRESNFLVEETGSHERPRLETGGGSSPAAARHVSADETISSETAINLDQGDPLAEADFHMAYGLYDQAADLVRIAIQREPARRDLKLKLLEVFFVWGNKEQFLQAARELAESRADAAPGEWEKIVIMGKQLAPEDPMFAGGAAVSGAAAGGVDLDLEGGASRVDFDVLGDSSPTQASPVDLDIGTAIGERGDINEATAHTDENLALRDDDTVERDVVNMTTRQMTTKLGTGSATTIEEFGPPGNTVEQPTLRVPPTTIIRQPPKAAGAEHTTELAYDDLGLDLSGLGGTGSTDTHHSGPDSPTLVAALDDDSQTLFESAAPSLSDSNGRGLKESETGSWHLDGVEEGDTSTTSRLKALKAKAVDFDIGEAQAAKAASANGAHGLDLDVGTATLPDVVFTKTQQLGTDDLALPDLDPVTMSEVGTKLDLARAYMDMGDPEGARNILEEVLSEGSVAQKQEAQRLISSLPG